MTDSHHDPSATSRALREAEKAIIRDFNQRDYRTSWEGASGAFEHRFEGMVIRELLPDQPGWWIDVGAGYGRLLPLYYKQDRKIVLVDYAVNLLQMAAQENAYDNVYFVAADAYHLPFRSGSVDAGLSIHTFAHINAASLFLGEIARVMRNGSRVVMEYPNKRSLFRILRYGVRCFRVDREEYVELFFGTHPTHFAKLCEAAGLQVLSTRGSGYLSRILKKAPFLSPILGVAEAVLMKGFGTRELASRNFAEVQKVPADESGPGSVQYTHILDILMCPACGGSFSENDSGNVACNTCAHMFVKEGNIYDMRYTGDSEVRPLA